MAIRLTNTNQQLDSGTTGTIFVSEQPNTQMVWIKKSVFVGQGRRSLVGCYNPTAKVGFQFGISNNTNFAVWRWGGRPLITYPNSSIATNEWLLMVYAWNGVNNRFWINNQLLSTNTTQVPQTGNINQIWINGFPTGNSFETANDYEIADYRLYNRALSENELTTIYTLRGKDINFTGLVGRWPLNEGPVDSTVSSPRDISFNKNNLIVLNTPTYSESTLSYIPTIA